MRILKAFGTIAATLLLAAFFTLAFVASCSNTTADSNQNYCHPQVVFEDCMLQVTDPQNFSYFEWRLNGQIIAGATNSTYKPVQSGTYNVRTVPINCIGFYYSRYLIVSKHCNE